MNVNVRYIKQLAIILVLAMIVSVFPLTAVAAEDQSAEIPSIIPSATIKIPGYEGERTFTFTNVYDVYFRHINGINDYFFAFQDGTLMSNIPFSTSWLTSIIDYESNIPFAVPSKGGLLGYGMSPFAGFVINNGWFLEAESEYFETFFVGLPSVNDYGALRKYLSAAYEMRPLSELYIEAEAPVTCTVTATAGAGGTATGSGTYQIGASVTLTATPNSGYTFDGWYENNVKIDGAGVAYTFTASDNRTVKARFAYDQSTYTPSIIQSATIAIPGLEEGRTFTLTNVYDGYFCFRSNSGGYTYFFALQNGTLATNVAIPETWLNPPDLIPNEPFVVPSDTGALVEGMAPVKGTWLVDPQSNEYYAYIEFNFAGLTSVDDFGVFHMWLNMANIRPLSELYIEAETPATYTVTATAGNGGTATGGGTYQIGESVTVTTTPNSGYTFAGWYENNARIDGAGATYTFTVTTNRTLEARFTYNPPYTGGGGGSSSGGGGSGGSSVIAPTPKPSVTPSATPKPTTTPRPSATPEVRLELPGVIPRPRNFEDVRGKYWAYKYISELAENGIIDGYTTVDGTFTFEPENSISRAEIVKLIVASLALPLESDFDGSDFADWNSVEEWVRPYVGAAVTAGIVNGSLEDGGLLLDMSTEITREEMIVMAIRALGLTVEDDVSAPDSITDFEDSSEWATSSLAFAINNGMINTDGDEIRPLDDATRAEAAMMLYKMLEYKLDIGE